MRVVFIESIVKIPLLNELDKEGKKATLSKACSLPSVYKARNLHYVISFYYPPCDAGFISTYYGWIIWSSNELCNLSKIPKFIKCRSKIRSGGTGSKHHALRKKRKHICRRYNRKQSKSRRHRMYYIFANFYSWPYLMFPFHEWIPFAINHVFITGADMTAYNWIIFLKSEIIAFTLRGMN